MNIHRVLLTVVATITAGVLHAQTINGKVVDATSQEPIIGATIVIGNDKKGGNSNRHQWTLCHQGQGTARCNQSELCRISQSGD